MDDDYMRRANVSIKNFEYLKRANEKGVDLETLAMEGDGLRTEINDLRKQIDELKRPDTSAELFTIRETKVRSDPEVLKAQELKVKAWKPAIEKILIAQDKGYSDAAKNYEKAVNEAYLRKEKQTENAEPADAPDM